MLVDDDLALFGTMNLDNRSMRLNFEVGILVENETFAARVSDMLEEDLGHCHELRPSDLRKRSPWYRLKARTARLFASIL